MSFQLCVRMCFYKNKNKGLCWRRTGRVQDCLRELLHNKVMALAFLIFINLDHTLHIHLEGEKDNWPRWCFSGFDVRWRLRYVEKQPGKFVGDTGCEKLPVEVFALLIVIMGVIMVLVGVNDDSWWWQLFHLENRFAELVALLRRGKRSAMTRWLAGSNAWPHLTITFWVAQLNHHFLFQSFPSSWLERSSWLKPLLLSGNCLPGRCSWGDLWPQPTENLQVCHQACSQSVTKARVHNGSPRGLHSQVHPAKASAKAFDDQVVPRPNPTKPWTILWWVRGPWWCSLRQRSTAIQQIGFKTSRETDSQAADLFMNI